MKWVKMDRGREEEKRREIGEEMDDERKE